MLLVDPRTHLPVPLAATVVAAAADPRIKTELPASQVELATGAHDRAEDAVGELAELRRALLAACDADVCPAFGALRSTPQTLTGCRNTRFFSPNTTSTIAKVSKGRCAT